VVLPNPEICRAIKAPSTELRRNSKMSICWVNLWVALFTITTSISAIPPVAAKSTAAYRVGNNEKNKHDNVYNCDLSPVLLDFLKDPSLA
jgi:hypothetical protein